MFRFLLSLCLVLSASVVLACGPRGSSCGSGSCASDCGYMFPQVVNYHNNCDYESSCVCSPCECSPCQSSPRTTYSTGCATCKGGCQLPPEPKLAPTTSYQATPVKEQPIPTKAIQPAPQPPKATVPIPDPVVPHMEEAPMPMKPLSTGRFILHVPENAVVIVNGYQTKTTGAVRTYVCKNLNPRYYYNCDIVVHWQGQTYHGDIQLSAGDKLQYAVEFPASDTMLAKNP